MFRIRGKSMIEEENVSMKIKTSQSFLADISECFVTV